MNAQRTNARDLAEDVNSTIPEVEPDYQAWEGIDDAPKSAFVEVFRYLGQRTIFEVSIIGSLAGLIYLGREIINGGAGLTPPQGYHSLLMIAVMIFATPILLHYYRAGEGRSDGKIKQRSQDPPEPGNE